MKIFLVTISLFFSHWSFGQIGGTLANPYADITNSDVLNFRVYEEYKGSPYLFEDFLAGKITLNNGSSQTFDSLKLDCYKHQVLYKTDGRILALDNKKLKELFFFKGSHQFKLMTEDGENKWFKMLYVGEIVLMKQYDVDLIIEDRQSASSYGGSTDVNKKVFTRKDSYFWMDSNSSLISQVPTKKKEFINQFSNNNVEIESYIKTNKLKLNNDEDLMKIFRELNRK